MSLILQSCFFDQTRCQYPTNGSTCIVLSVVFLTHVYRVMQSIIGHSICISMSLINSYSCFRAWFTTECGLQLQIKVIHIQSLPTSCHPHVNWTCVWVLYRSDEHFTCQKKTIWAHYSALWRESQHRYKWPFQLSGQENTYQWCYKV